MGLLPCQDDTITKETFYKVNDRYDIASVCLNTAFIITGIIGYYIVYVRNRHLKKPMFVTIIWFCIWSQTPIFIALDVITICFYYDKNSDDKPTMLIE